MPDRVWHPSQDPLAPLHWPPTTVRVVGDVFAPEHDDAWRDRVFAVMALSWWQTFELSTAHPAEAHQYGHNRKASAQVWTAATSLIAVEHFVAYTPRRAQICDAIYNGQHWPLPNVRIAAEKNPQEGSNP